METLQKLARSLRTARASDLPKGRVIAKSNIIIKNTLVNQFPPRPSTLLFYS